MNRKILTIVVADTNPVVHCGLPPDYRTIRIELTDEQSRDIEIKAGEQITNVIIDSGWKRGEM